MKLKIFTMALVIIVLLTGCGERSGWMSAEPSQPPGPTQEVEPETSVTPPVTMPEEPLKTDDGAEPTGGAQEEKPAEPEETTECLEIEGLIVMTITTRDFVDSLSIYMVNVETGETREIAAWPNYSLLGERNIYYYINHGSDPMSFAWRRMFSEDFQKRAVTKAFHESKGYHAGWMNTDGEFFDVTEALGLEPEESFFSEPVYYTADGFVDNWFVYYARDDKGDPTYYYVPIDNLKPEEIREGCPIKFVETTDSYGWTQRLNGLTWVDEMTAIINREVWAGNEKVWESVLFDTLAGTETQFLPASDKRNNWSAVLSPGGQSVAFLSETTGHSDIPNIYVMPMSGGEPTKVVECKDLGMTKRTSPDFYLEILEWR